MVEGLLFVLFVLFAPLILPLILLVVFLINVLLKMNSEFIKKYTRNVWVGVDQFYNTILLGDEDETISSRCGKLRNNGNPLFADVIDWVVFIITKERNHCSSCIEEDEGENSL